MRIEISALTPLRELADVRALVVGRDGVQLKNGQRQAVFLPQVASAQGWQAEQLLGQLAVKAGLEKSAWRGSELCVFQAEVFGEGTQSGS